MAPCDDRFEVDIDGSEGSNAPAFCDCFRICATGLARLVVLAFEGGSANGEAFRNCGSWLAVTDLAARAAAEEIGEGVGREKFCGFEKFCRLVWLEFGWLDANWAYIGAEREGAGEAVSRGNCGLYSDVGLLAFAMCMGIVVSSLEEDSTRRTLGLGGGGISGAAAADDDEYMLCKSLWLLALL